MIAIVQYLLSLLVALLGLFSNVSAAPPHTFVALGDSLTAWPTTASWPTQLASITGLKLLNNAGVPGDWTSDMLDRMDTDVEPYQPDLLYVFGGLNDLKCGFTVESAVNNVKAIVRTARSQGITHLAVILVPHDSLANMQDKIDTLDAALASFATEAEIPYVDLRPIVNARDTSDGVHFTAAGAAKVSKAIAATLND